MGRKQRRGMKKSCAQRIARGLALRMLGELGCESCGKVFSKPTKLRAHSLTSPACKQLSADAIRTLMRSRDEVARRVRETYHADTGAGGQAAPLERALHAVAAIESQEEEDYRIAGVPQKSDGGRDAVDEETDDGDEDAEMTMYAMKGGAGGIDPAGARADVAAAAAAAHGHTLHHDSIPRPRLSPSVLLWDASAHRDPTPAASTCPAVDDKNNFVAAHNGDAAQAILRFGARRLRVRDVAMRADTPEPLLGGSSVYPM